MIGLHSERGEDTRHVFEREWLTAWLKDTIGRFHPSITYTPYNDLNKLKTFSFCCSPRASLLRCCVLAQKKC